MKLLEWAMGRSKGNQPDIDNIATLNAKKLKSANRLFSVFNPMSFIIGDIKFEELDTLAGTMKLEVIDCAYLRAGRMEKLPENGCLLFCKGSCERLFGDDAPMKMEFDPHLPETSCTIMASWKHR